MLKYHREQIYRLSGSNICTKEQLFDDIFSEYLFREVLRQLDGVEHVKYDIFIHIYRDGADPFQSASYSFWATIIFNHLATIRVQLKNVLSMFVIPCLNNPKDLLAFIEQLIDELPDLRNSFMFCDGVSRLVPVHGPIVGGDIESRTKLTARKDKMDFSVSLLQYTWSLCSQSPSHVPLISIISKTWPLSYQVMAKVSSGLQRTADEN